MIMWSSAVKEDSFSSLVFLGTGDSVLPLNKRVPFFLSVKAANTVCVFSQCVHKLTPDPFNKERNIKGGVWQRLSLCSEDYRCIKIQRASYRNVTHELSP